MKPQPQDSLLFLFHLKLSFAMLILSCSSNFYFSNESLYLGLIEGKGLYRKSVYRFFRFTVFDTLK